MFFKNLIFLLLGLILYSIQDSESERVRVRRALFNTGKFLIPKPKPKPKPVIELRKYPAASEETRFKPQPRPFYPPIFFPLRRRWPNRNQIFKREGAPRVQSPPIQPPPEEQVFQHQVGGDMSDSWAQTQRQARFPSTETDVADNLVDVDGQPEGHKDCKRIPDGAADLLCNYIKEDTEKDGSEFLWVPLTTPLVGYPVNTRLERWFQKGCFNWKLKTCSGSPRYPLASKCRFWSPEPVAIPGCPQISKEQEVSWKDYPPNHCPCKWPCTKLFESIQECYQMPNATNEAVDEESVPAPKQTPSLLRLSSSQAFQLCRAADKGVIHGVSVSLGWIPIPLSTKRNDQQRGAQCSDYVFHPCLGGRNDKEGCGKWRKQRGTCEGNDGFEEARGRGSSMGTASCPCQLPCIRFFDAINKCDESLFSRSGAGGADPSAAVSLLLRDAPREGTASSLVECNIYDKELFCTIIPAEDKMDENRAVDLDTDLSPSSRRHGRVKCEHVDSKPVCKFVYD